MTLEMKACQYLDQNAVSLLQTWGRETGLIKYVGLHRCRHSWPRTVA